ncbi:YI31B [Hepatospora eriocheir]|uniref:YI31B n=1 Tax=Hepatospora eriocheir TaxID=1081669 RepID=A0A1X0Q5M8_9MICR|nr:YI31B [Hepatospora eriocheir]
MENNNKFMNSENLNKPNDELNKVIEEYSTSININEPIKNTSFQIKISSSEPVKKKPYTIFHKIASELKDHIDELLSKNIIKRFDSSYAFPWFVKRKPDGRLRLLIDYRKLNYITIDDAYPFPSTKELVRDLSGAKIFSQLDMEKGYYQIKIDSNDTYMTSFVLPNGLYEFTRMPFGLKNTPRIFQRVMQQILNGLDFVKVYLDYILIHSENINNHIQHCKIVLERLKNHNVKINFDKINLSNMKLNTSGLLFLIKE